MRDRVFAVFAYNEQNNIIACLRSIQQQSEDEIYVLINGCTDQTQAIVEQYSRKNPAVKPISIIVGDKSNAWNVFVHDLAIEAKMYFFLDGDCIISKDAINTIEHKSKERPTNAVAATPIGRTKNRKNTTKIMLNNGGLAGNFYSLSQDFIGRIRQLEIKIPIGTIGDDSFIGALACWDLDPNSNWNCNNILVLEDANFDYKGLSIFSVNDLKLYYRRKIRYSMRFFQNKIFSELLKTKGINGLPCEIRELYLKNNHNLSLSWRGIDTYFDIIALKNMNNKPTNNTKKQTKI